MGWQLSREASVHGDVRFKNGPVIQKMLCGESLREPGCEFRGRSTGNKLLLAAHGIGRTARNPIVRSISKEAAKKTGFGPRGMETGYSSCSSVVTLQASSRGGQWGPAFGCQGTNGSNNALW